jgi:hypothetical protein
MYIRTEKKLNLEVGTRVLNVAAGNTVNAIHSFVNRSYDGE